MSLNVGPRAQSTTRLLGRAGPVSRNRDVCPPKPGVTWDGTRRWSAVLSLAAAAAMGSPVVACGSHDKTGPATTTTTTTTAPAPGGNAPGATVTQTVTPSQPTYVQPPFQGPGDYSPFGGHTR